ncbi:ANTAR domain-containing protein [Micromonospora sp. BQ11]|uniref:GAF and ANTAR domain-containing protein n=1 Tax=Micromonospora sp. BQ11 TaxID=3452212 RepID=UPI003F8C35FE
MTSGHRASSAAAHGHAIGSDAADRDQQQRTIDTGVAASATAMSAPHTDTDPYQSVRDSTLSAAQRRTVEVREQDLDRRERQWTSRKADADAPRRLLDNREHETRSRERGADQREIDAEAANGNEDRHRLSSGPPVAEAVVMRFGALARSLHDLDDTEATAQAIVAVAVDTVPGATYAGLSMTSRQPAAAIVVTDQVVSHIDQAQHDTGEGPAMTSLREHRTVRVDDMAADTRWPRFAARAAQIGVGSMLAVQVYVRREDLGVLTLYSRDPHAFDDDAEQIALLFATHAAVALAGAHNAQHLTTALKNRDAIGQAKGILMERYRLSADQAFAVLTRASQNTNTKIVDVARTLTENGTLPGAVPDTDGTASPGPARRPSHGPLVCRLTA